MNHFDSLLDSYGFGWVHIPIAAQPLNCDESCLLKLFVFKTPIICWKGTDIVDIVGKDRKKEMEKDREREREMGDVRGRFH